MDIDVEFHTGLRVLKACLALPILILTSSSAPPSDVMILPKYVKLWMSSSSTSFSFIFSSCLPLALMTFIGLFFADPEASFLCNQCQMVSLGLHMLQFLR